jgi:hypothetical protein
VNQRILALNEERTRGSEERQDLSLRGGCFGYVNEDEDKTGRLEVDLRERESAAIPPIIVISTE